MTSASTPHDPLHAYVVGKLGSAEAEQFRDHLADCESCREELSFLENVREGVEHHGEAFFEDHPSVERLVATARGESPEDEAQDVHRHIALCAACEAETQWVRGEVAADGRSTSPDVADNPRSHRVDVARWAGWLVAVAASILLFVPLLRDRGGATGFVRSQFLESAERAAGQATVIELQPDDARFVVAIEIDLPAAGFPISVEVTGENGATIYQQSGIERESLLDDIHAFFECDVRDCPPGRYTVTITSADPAEPVEHREFEVVRR